MKGVFFVLQVVKIGKINNNEHYNKHSFMTREEYLLKTGIKNQEEAKSRLWHLNCLFAFFVTLLVIKSGIKELDENTHLLLFAVYAGLLMFFWAYCVKIIRLTRNVTRAKSYWLFVLAPISWLWFYSEITRPLKIIVGEIEPPDKFPTKEDRSIARESVNKWFWKWFKIVAVVFVVLAGFSVVWVMVGSQNKPTETDLMSSMKTIPLQENSGYHYVSSDAGFEINFPTKPTREEDVQNTGDDRGEATVITYQSVKDNNSYFVFFYQFTNPAVDENSSDYNVKSGLEGSINSMLNSIKDASLTNSSFTSFQDHQALSYTLSFENESIEGLMFMNGKYIYNIAIDYDVNNVTPEPSLQKFLSSFKFRIP